jgi:hypothetical protein
MSDWFKDNVYICKIFYINLGSFNIFYFNFYLHLGPGILLIKYF